MKKIIKREGKLYNVYEGMDLVESFKDLDEARLFLGETSYPSMHECKYNGYEDYNIIESMSIEIERKKKEVLNK